MVSLPTIADAPTNFGPNELAIVGMPNQRGSMKTNTQKENKKKENRKISADKIKEKTITRGNKIRKALT